jgi:hypothetical protein
MADEINTPEPQKRKRRTKREVAEAKAAQRRLVQERKRRLRFEELDILTRVARLLLLGHQRPHQIAKTIGKSESQTNKYIRKIAETTREMFKGEFKSEIDKILAIILTGYEDRAKQRANQLSALLQRQERKDENGNIYLYADPEIVAQIRLLLDSNSDDEDKLITKLLKLGIVSGGAGGGESDLLLEIKARHASSIKINTGTGNDFNNSQK